MQGLGQLVLSIPMSYCVGQNILHIFNLSALQVSGLVLNGLLGTFFQILMTVHIVRLFVYVSFVLYTLIHLFNNPGLYEIAISGRIYGS
jgi:hypothetical protein